MLPFHEQAMCQPVKGRAEDRENVSNLLNYKETRKRALSSVRNESGPAADYRGPGGRGPTQSVLQVTQYVRLHGARCPVAGIPTARSSFA